ncbi:3'-5' exonuclease [Helicobacter sp. 11S02629-2]|uniref:3'-5' exonuclease n=1 Tax=Helicobacter sp. 11S02629-2 TaxID=1476195 RepID=UPI000BA7D119|nr:3'-5' exonuclease [Helicobacter sp. 11S02629-2]PAF44622.1 hypothetical protein BKH40_05175 [Helicobacter sp. 11S02629-2]
MKFNHYNQLVEALYKAPIPKDVFMKNIRRLFDYRFQVNTSLKDALSKKLEGFLSTLIDNSLEDDTTLEVLKAYGMPIVWDEDFVTCSLKGLSLDEATFCFVDIETTGPRPSEDELLEIGALKCKGGKILGTFQSLVRVEEIPENIQELTSITPDMTKDAPLANKVLGEFKAFLGESIFVAHGIDFDYNFIADTLRYKNMPLMLNPKLCSLLLAKKTILSKKYSISFLNDFLGLEVPVQHRAYEDALCSKKICDIASFMLPYSVDDVLGLFEFARGKSGYPKSAIFMQDKYKLAKEEDAAKKASLESLESKTESLIKLEGVNVDLEILRKKRWLL